MAKKKAAIIAIIILTVIALLSGWAIYCQRDQMLTGEVERELIPQISEVNGKILEINVVMGQSVKQGEVLARIDPSDQQYALTQLQLVLQQKQAALEQLYQGAEPEEIKQAQNNISIAITNYDNARIAHEQAQLELANAQQLFANGGISPSGPKA